MAVSARLDGDQLNGNFTSTDDHGPIVLHHIGTATTSALNSGNLSLTPSQWRDDLALFVRELTAKHPDPFANTTKEKFDADAAQLERNLDRLNSDEIYIGMDHLANLIGDAHTFVEFPSDNANLPLDIRHFGDESRIVAVTSGYEQALGARVIAIHDVPIKEARTRALDITPVFETESLRQSRIDGFLTTGMALHGLKITPDRNLIPYKLESDDGTEFTVAFKAILTTDHPKWISIVPQPPLSEQPVKGSGSCTYLRDAHTLYCNIRQIRDLGQVSKQMLDSIHRDHPLKLAVDLRRNNGGDFNQGLKYLIEPLAKEKEVNQTGHLFVLVGVNTFSAAMSNAAQFRQMTKALLVGESIGERPNSYQEPRQFTLPNSQLIVRYSTRFYKFAEGSDNVIVPDKQIETSWDDYKNGRDPVLEWVLKP